MSKIGIFSTIGAYGLRLYTDTGNAWITKHIEARFNPNLLHSSASSTYLGHELIHQQPLVAVHAVPNKVH